MKNGFAPPSHDDVFSDSRRHWTMDNFIQLFLMDDIFHLCCVCICGYTGLKDRFVGYYVFELRG